MKRRLWNLIVICCFDICCCWDFIGNVEHFFNYERCNENWIKFNDKGFQNDLKNKVFGQPFLEKALLPLLTSHFEASNNPSKPLVMSFHGSPGTGKTFVSQLIADNIFFRGRDSQFYRHFKMAEMYSLTQNELLDEIKNLVRKCPRTVIVFDEIEKMPDGTFESIKSFLDHYHSVDKIDFRKSTFIFLSNIGMDKINSVSKDLWDNGVLRENYKLADFWKKLMESAFESDGGLKGTRIVKNYLIDLYLPFLPLEKEHIEKCIRTVCHDISPKTVKNIIDELVFVPKESPIFALTGCRTIQSFVKRSTSQFHDEF